MIGFRGVRAAVFGGLAMVLAGSAVAPCDVRAQDGGCVTGCRSAYADCYRSTSNRAACEAQMQRCMQGCISSKRR
jgi:hypothetical protein